MAAEPVQPAAFETVPSESLNTLEDDLSWLLSRLEGVGITEVIAVDLTKPAFDIPVMRVVIPGLEGPHDHDDYCPGSRARRLGVAAR